MRVTKQSTKKAFLEDCTLKLHNFLRTFAHSKQHNWMYSLCLHSVFNFGHSLIIDSIAARARASHLSFSGCPACPLTHAHLISCFSLSFKSRSHKSRFFTGCLFAFFQSRLIQPSIHTVMPLIRYSLSVVRMTRLGVVKDSRPTIAASISI